MKRSKGVLFVILAVVAASFCTQRAFALQPAPEKFEISADVVSELRRLSELEDDSDFRIDFERLLIDSPEISTDKPSRTYGEVRHALWMQPESIPTTYGMLTETPPETVVLESHHWLSLDTRFSDALLDFQNRQTDKELFVLYRQSYHCGPRPNIVVGGQGRFSFLARTPIGLTSFRTWDVSLPTFRETRQPMLDCCKPMRRRRPT
ncbi:MAG: hypothetical protein R3C05_28640 [Pirellulaceae bacterium]